MKKVLLSVLVLLACVSVSFGQAREPILRDWQAMKAYIDAKIAHSTTNSTLYSPVLVTPTFRDATFWYNI